VRYLPVALEGQKAGGRRGAIGLVSPHSQQLLCEVHVGCLALFHVIFALICV